MSRTWCKHIEYWAIIQCNYMLWWWHTLKWCCLMEFQKLFVHAATCAWVVKNKSPQNNIIFLIQCSYEKSPVRSLLWSSWLRTCCLFCLSICSSGRYRFIEEEESAGSYYVALELSDPQPVDGATYKLQAKNQHGESNANLKLNFDGKKDRSCCVLEEGSGNLWTNE